MFSYRAGLFCARTKLTTIPRIQRPFSCTVRLVKKYGNPQKYRSQQPQQPRSDQEQHDQYGQSQSEADQWSRREQETYDRWNNQYEYPKPPRFNIGKIVTGSTIAACVGVTGTYFLYKAEIQQNFSNKAIAQLAEFEKHFVMKYEGIKNGRYYTILTSALNHTSILHLGFNMLMLWSFAPMTIQLFGTPTFMCLFVGSVVVGGVSQYIWWDKSKDYGGGAVGASGGLSAAPAPWIRQLLTVLSGVFAALACVMPRAGVQLFAVVPMQMWICLVGEIGASIAGLQGYWGPSIGHADHLGGTVFGLVFWLLILRRRPMGYMPYYG